MTPNTSAHPSVDGRELLERAGFTRLAADYVPAGCDVEEGWRVHDFPAGSHVAHCLCDGLEEGEAKLIAAAVNAYPDYLDRLTSTAALQERVEPYLVWSNEHAAWWGKDRCGYTRVIARAGRYSREEALCIAGTRDGGWHPRKGNPDEIAIPERDAISQYAAITAQQEQDATLTKGATA